MLVNGILCYSIVMVDTPKQNATDSEATNNHPNESEKESADTSMRSPAKSNAIPPTKQFTTTKRRRKYWFEWGKFIVEVLTLLIISSYTVIAYHQWDEMRIATKATQEAADAAKAGADAAIQSLADSRSDFKNDQRPFIWLRNSLETPRFWINPVTKNTGQILWDWHVVNYGKTPVANMQFRQYMKEGSKPFVASYGERGGNFGSPIPPNADILSDTVVSAPLTPAEYSDLIKTDYGIQIKVIIDYTDLYGGKYETGFCLSRLQNSVVSFCREGNYIK